jgi:hypothetical protein
MGQCPSRVDRDVAHTRAGSHPRGCRQGTSSPKGVVRMSRSQTYAAVRNTIARCRRHSRLVGVALPAVVLVGSCAVAVTPASAAIADVVGGQRGPSLNEIRQAPDRSVLAQKGSAFDAVEQQADQSLRESAPEDLSSDPRGERSDLENALKRCLVAGLNSAATAAANNRDTAPAAAFETEAKGCLKSTLAGLDPTADAIHELVVYLAYAVGGEITEPQSTNAPRVNSGGGSQPNDPTTQSASRGGSSFAWWIILLGIVGLFAVGGAIKSAWRGRPLVGQWAAKG